MVYHILTLFPELIQNICSASILGRAQKEGLIHVNPINIRDFTDNNYKQADDYPYGGGSGLVMKPEPIYKAYQNVLVQINETPAAIYVTPQGQPFTQGIAQELSKLSHLVILCGHYEGIDERVVEEIQPVEISLGDFILTGGELAASVIIDATARLIPGVLGSPESFVDESFQDSLLEYPQYTRPAEFLGRKVPEVLLSGHHKNIDHWRREQSLLRTFQKRPDLLQNAKLTEEEQAYLKSIRNADRSE